MRFEPVTGFGAAMFIGGGFGKRAREPLAIQAFVTRLEGVNRRHSAAYPHLSAPTVIRTRSICGIFQMRFYLSPIIGRTFVSRTSMCGEGRCTCNTENNNAVLSIPSPFPWLFIAAGYNHKVGWRVHPGVPAIRDRALLPGRTSNGSVRSNQQSRLACAERRRQAGQRQVQLLASRSGQRKTSGSSRISFVSNRGIPCRA